MKPRGLSVSTRSHRQRGRHTRQKRRELRPIKSTAQVPLSNQHMLGRILTNGSSTRPSTYGHSGHEAHASTTLPTRYMRATSWIQAALFVSNCRISLNFSCSPSYSCRSSPAALGPPRPGGLRRDPQLSERPWRAGRHAASSTGTRRSRWRRSLSPSGI